MTARQLVRFPPRRGNVFVPSTPRSATLAGMALYAGCRRRVLVAQRVAWLVVRLGGSALLPGVRHTWRAPVSSESWTELLDQWRRELGHFDRYAVITRIQRSRPGCSLLLLFRGHPVAFVKVRDREEGLQRELSALSLLSKDPLSAVQVPSPLGVGRAGAVAWLATSPLPSRLHRPVPMAPVDELLKELRERLGGLPRPSGMPTTWEPMHGDLAPWNLRQVGGQRWLLDWEDAGYGPAGADALYYRITCASVAVAVSPLAGVDLKTVAFWRAALSHRPDGDVDASLSFALRAELDRYDSGRRL